MSLVDRATASTIARPGSPGTRGRPSVAAGRGTAPPPGVSGASRVALICSLAALACSLAGCGGGGGGGGSSSGGGATYSVGGTVTGLAGTGLVLRNNGGNDLPVSASGAFSFSVKAATGARYAVTVFAQPSNPFQTCIVTGGTGSGFVGTADVTSVTIVCATVGRFAYATSQNGNSVYAFTIDPIGGGLAPLAASPYPVGSQPVSVAVDAAGKYLYVANFGSGNVSGYAIDPSSGALVAIPGSPFAAGFAPLSVAIHPSGKFAYVANVNSGDVSAYAINPASGALVAIAGSPFAAGSLPFAAAVDPGGRFLYVANSGVPSDGISAYSIDAATGALTPTPGSPAPAGRGATSIAIDPGGRYAYVANNPSGQVSAYTIDSASGALAAIAGSPYASGTTPTSATVEASGTFLYVASSQGFGGSGGNNLTAYRISAGTGALTPIAGSPFATGVHPTSVAADPSGRFLYVAILDGIPAGGVAAYVIDPASGALAEVPGSLFPAGDSPSSVAVSK